MLVRCYSLSALGTLASLLVAYHSVCASVTSAIIAPGRIPRHFQVQAVASLALACLAYQKQTLPELLPARRTDGRQNLPVELHAYLTLLTDRCSWTERQHLECSLDPN